MQHKFKKLKEKYDSFQNHLLNNGKLLAKDTVIGYWGVTPLEEAFELFNVLNLQQYKNFMDLGCGDGRIVLLASLFGVEAHGIEFDRDLVHSSLLIKNSLPGFAGKILHDNFMDYGLEEYEIIYISPDKPFHRKGLELKLLREMQGRLVVHGWEFHPQQLKKEEEHVIGGEKFTVYTRPS